MERSQAQGLNRMGLSPQCDPETFCLERDEED